MLEYCPLNGKSMKGPDLLRMLNKIGGKYGIGRELFAGDTIIGIKGRFLSNHLVYLFYKGIVFVII
mgnify:CR=1 FL=1